MHPLKTQHEAWSMAKEDPPFCTAWSFRSHGWISCKFSHHFGHESWLKKQRLGTDFYEISRKWDTDGFLYFIFIFPTKNEENSSKIRGPFNLSSRTFFELAMLPPCRGPNSTSWGETCVDSRAQGNGTSIWGAKGWGWWLVNRTFSPSVFPLRNKGLNDWGKPISLIRPLIRCYFSGGVALGFVGGGWLTKAGGVEKTNPSN